MWAVVGVVGVAALVTGTTTWQRHDQFILPGTYIDQDHSYLSFTNLSSCECRVRCVTQASCLAWAWLPDGGPGLCRLADHGPLTSKLKGPQPGAVYGYLVESLAGGLMDPREGDDGLVYFIPRKRGRQTCKEAPGFRPAILRTANQIQTAMSLGFYFRIDLENVNGQLVWGDGSLYPQHLHSFLESRPWEQFGYVAHNGVITANLEHYHYLCQGRRGDEQW